MSTISLPPGKYAIHAATSIDPTTKIVSYSPTLAVAAPNAPRQPLIVDNTQTPFSFAQQWIITGDGYLTAMSAGDFVAFADVATSTVKSGVSGTDPLTKFLINVTAQTSVPGILTAGYTGTIRTPDIALRYVSNSATGAAITLARDATLGSNWAFIPVTTGS